MLYPELHAFVSCVLLKYVINKLFDGKQHCSHEVDCESIVEYRLFKHT